MQYPAQGFFFFWEPVPIVQIPPPCLGSGRTRKGVPKREELFENSVIQKRPFNARTWGAEGRKCRWHRSKLLKLWKEKSWRKKGAKSLFYFLYLFLKCFKREHQRRSEEEGSAKLQLDLVSLCLHALRAAAAPADIYYRFINTSIYFTASFLFLDSSMNDRSTFTEEHLQLSTSQICMIAAFVLFCVLDKNRVKPPDGLYKHRRCLDIEEDIGV